MIVGKYREQFSVKRNATRLPPSPFLANVRLADNPGPVSHGDYDGHATYTYRAFSVQVD
jgi:hypothetical protein